MKNILVATDGSAEAERAVITAAQLATAQGAKLTIVNVQAGRPLGEQKDHFADEEFRKAIENRTDLPDDLRLAFLRLNPPAVADITTGSQPF